MEKTRQELLNWWLPVQSEISHMCLSCALNEAGVLWENKMRACN